MFIKAWMWRHNVWRAGRPTKRINLLYDDVEWHYHVIVNLTVAMARRYLCKACKHVTKYVGETLRSCVNQCVATVWRAPRALSPPLESPALNVIEISGTKLVSWTTTTSNKKFICERRRCCSTYGAIVTRENNDCNKRYCEICNQKIDVGYLCYDAS